MHVKEMRFLCSARDSIILILALIKSQPPIHTSYQTVCTLVYTVNSVTDKRRHTLITMNMFDVLCQLISALNKVFNNGYRFDIHARRITTQHTLRQLLVDISIISSV